MLNKTPHTLHLLLFLQAYAAATACLCKHAAHIRFICGYCMNKQLRPLHLLLFLQAHAVAAAVHAQGGRTPGSAAAVTTTWLTQCYQPQLLHAQSAPSCYFC
jgi:hypothetical protein